MTYRILFRGSLSSCNYACDYCPFAKTTNTVAQLRHDEKQLNRFVDWIEAQDSHQFGLLFTPWGEALIHSYYHRALTRLSHLPHVKRVAIQTNLSGKLDWVRRSNKQTLALWTTYHPSQGKLGIFLNQCRFLDGEGVRYSVGIVGLKENLGATRQLRQRLDSKVYLWVNAYKDKASYYDESEVKNLAEIDPLFPLNNQRHASLGKACRTGETVFSVDGDGRIYRCHFIKNALGNIYEGDFTTALRPRACSNSSCGCHIGYVHLEELQLDTVFGDNILERIPRGYPQDSRQILSSKE